jgi:hypothetical protein
MENFGADPTVVGCAFVGNTAYDGGGIRNIAGNTVMVNCAFVGNSAIAEGGGVLSREPNNPIIINCTFVGNSAASGGAVHSSSFATTMIVNSILWANTAPEGPQISVSSQAAASVAFSDVDGGEAAVFVDGTSTVNWLDGNVDDDPMFVDPGNDDYRLLACSPCIDAGANTAVPPDTLDLDGDGDTNEPIPLDLDGNPRFEDDPNTPDTGNGRSPLVDVGAYEFPGCPWDCDGTNDGSVNVSDFLALLAQWDTTSPPCDSGGDCDVNGDGTVGITDFLALLTAWGPC